MGNVNCKEGAAVVPLLHILFNEVGSQREALMVKTGERVLEAVRILIGAARRAEQIEGDELKVVRLHCDVELAEGSTETWLITVERSPTKPCITVEQASSKH
jgi:hypothetical protein